MLINNDLFSGRTLYVISKHNKYQVIAPLFERELSIKCTSVDTIDTDVLGTFTGEVERKFDSITTLRQKCNLARAIEGCDLVVATEGSFGNHPSIFFATANDEFIMLKDYKNEIEIIERVLSLDTNFYATEVKSVEELEDFINKAKFPSHAVIMKASKNDYSNMRKGITSKKKLFEYFQLLSTINGSCYLETDMRACYNPIRMNIIAQATEKLIIKVKSHCPQCNCPGFGIVDAILGLPCRVCHCPTNSVKGYIYTCQKCSYTKEESNSEHKKYEDPMYCEYCNP